nr:mismatch repair endonuclease PMS2 [Halyomorpha halys]
MENTKNSGSIKAIDKTTVHRICSGQVVLNLATAVKELVENSLDAGATVIDIKLKEYGSEIIEVVDNGAGVHPSNFEGLTLKHHTSKLQDFSDLVSVETFGFRGEALSSLCALSELSIVTRHESENCGTALSFDRNGHIIDRKQHARQVGTTVTLTNLFSALPVRQKEFHKNLKREFNKMTQLLSAYCLVSTGVKINCVNQTKSSRTTFLSTQGCKTVKENISCLFGAKQLSSLLEIKQTLPADEVLAELQVSEEDFSTFTLEGYISSCAHGSGRGSNDRQFYFINSRPCEPQKVTKQVNEVYHQFNNHQYPFVFLNINVTKGSVDINVTPDKRKVFLTEEKLLLALIKASILHLFEKIPSTFSYNNISICRNESLKNSEGSRPNFNKFDSWRHKSDGKRKSDCFDEKVPKKQSRIEVKNTSLLERFCIKEKKEKLDDSETEIKENDSTEHCSNIFPNINIVTDENSSIKQNKDSETKENTNIDITENNSVIFQNRSIEKNTFESTMNKTDDEQFKEVRDEISNNGDLSVMEEDSEIKETITSSVECFPERSKILVKEFIENKFISCSSSVDIEEQKGVQYSGYSETTDEKPSDNLVPIEFDEFEEHGVKSVFSTYDFNSIKKSFCERLSQSSHEEAIPTLRFRAVIDPSKNQQAEKELSKEISKEMFRKMEIIGQFNLGFIIAKLDSDLFIIDQHATDEKYNFETLQQTTVISNQKLVSPQVLELTAANECVVMENMNIFNKNGFEFHVDETAPPTKRISLTAIPMSKNWVFGKDDIDELIFMLQDSPGANCRPSRVRAMFASRACRKSVMIGTALSEKDMRRLVDNMSTIQHPWNCPHGRPTMRHLVNLDLITSKSD